MRRILFSIVSAGAFLCVQSAFSQAAGGGMPQGRNPATTPPTFPNQTTPSQGPAANRDSGSPDIPASKIDDRKFGKDVALSGITEVELGKLATEKASRDDIKEFGQKMVNDHTKANDLLKEVATKENFAIPDTLDSKHQSRVDKLSKLSGEEFDRAYVKDQLKDHQTAVRDFEAEAKNGTDANMKAFASNMLPTLQQHVELAKNLNKVEKVTAKQSKAQ